MKYNWKKELKIVRGIPGTGKSTHAKNEAKKINGKFYAYSICENDKFYIDKNGKYKYNVLLKEVAGWHTYGETFRAFYDFDTVFVSNCFCKKKHFLPYIEMCRKLEINVEIINMPPITVEESFARNTHNCSLESIQKMHDSFELFTQECCEEALYSMSKEKFFRLKQQGDYENSIMDEIENDLK